MTIIVGRRQIVGDLEGEIARLELLTADIRRVADGNLPTATELEAAPILDPWALIRGRSLA